MIIVEFHILLKGELIMNNMVAQFIMDLVEDTNVSSQIIEFVDAVKSNASKSFSDVIVSLGNQIYNNEVVLSLFSSKFGWKHININRYGNVEYEEKNPKVIWSRFHDTSIYDLGEFSGTYNDCLEYLNENQDTGMCGDFHTDFSNYGNRWFWNPPIDRILCVNCKIPVNHEIFTSRDVYELCNSDGSVYTETRNTGRKLTLRKGVFEAYLFGSRYFAAEVLETIKKFAKSDIYVIEA